MVEIANKTLPLIKNLLPLRISDSSSKFILSVNMQFIVSLSLDSNPYKTIDSMFLYSFSTRDKQEIRL